MINETIKTIQERRSIRAFSGESVAEEDLDLVLRSVQNAPNSMGAQQTSLIVIRDKERIQQMAKITGGQPQVAAADVFIVVVVDYNRTNIAVEKTGNIQAIHKTMEGQLAGAVDAGIYVALLDIAIQSLGYGATIIGGLRDQPIEAIEMMGLPEMTYPIVGITMGVKKKDDQTSLRPRVPFDSFCMDEVYDNEKVKQGVDQHDIDMEKFWCEQGQKAPNYSQAAANIYKQLYYPNTKPSLEKQKLGFE